MEPQAEWVMSEWSKPHAKDALVANVVMGARATISWQQSHRWDRLSYRIEDALMRAWLAFRGYA